MREVFFRAILTLPPVGEGVASRRVKGRRSAQGCVISVTALEQRIPAKLQVELAGDLRPAANAA
jgi:hypothetical protein